MHNILSVKNVPVFVPVFLNAVTVVIFQTNVRLKELFKVKNGLTTSLLFVIKCQKFGSVGRR